MTIVRTPMTAAGTRAADDMLWEPSFALNADWGTPVHVRTSWATDVVQGQDLAESRSGLRGRPRRIVAARTVTPGGPDAVRKARTLMYRTSQSRSLVPLYPDQSYVVAQHDAVSLDVEGTWDRRLNVGAYALLLQPRPDGSFYHEVAVIDSWTPTRLTFASALTLAEGPPGPDARVIPLIEATAASAQSVSALTDDLLFWDVQAQEAVGPSALPAFGSPNVAVDQFPVVNASINLFDLVPDWSQQVKAAVQREATHAASGITDIEQMKGLRPRFSGDVPIRLNDRATAFRFLKFFDSCRGRLYPFLIPAPVSELRGVSTTVNSVTVQAVGPTYDWSFFPYLCLHFYDGTILCRPIDSVVRTGSTDEVFVVGGFGATPPSLSQVHRINTAAKVRWDSDEVDEEWTTTEQFATTLPVVEVPFDADVDVDLTLPPPEIDPPFDTGPVFPPPDEPFDCSMTGATFRVDWSLTPDHAGPPSNVPNPSGSYVVSYVPSRGGWVSPGYSSPTGTYATLTCSDGELVGSVTISWYWPDGAAGLGVTFRQLRGSLAIPPFSPEQPLTGTWVASDVKRTGVQGPFLSQSGGGGTGEPVHGVTVTITRLS